MPSSVIEFFLRNVSASVLTDIFLIVLIVLFLLSVYWKRKHEHGAFTAYTPTLLTSVGILGTFAGIITGLLEFDTNDIDGSIGPLLEGLKTAFISSLVGMFLSITYKGIVTTGFLIPKQNVIVDEDDVGSIDIYNVLSKQVEGIEQLRNAIAGDEDSSLVSLMKLQRADNNDHFKISNLETKLIRQNLEGISELVKTQKEEFSQFQERLWRNLQEFADMLSKSATEQVIEALNQVIKDFNQNLTEQFGENFKELNAAVGKLVEWQENYKVQLEEMGRNYGEGVKAITATEASVAHISEDAKSIPLAMGELKQVMEVNQHQITELDRHLEAFKDIRDRAVEAVPEIRGQIDLAIESAKLANEELAKGIVASAEGFQNVVKEGADHYRASIDQTRAELKESSGELARGIVESAEGFRGIVKEGADQYRATIEETRADLKESTGELARGIVESAEGFRGIVKEGADQYQDAVDRTRAALTEAAQTTANSSEQIKDQFSSTLEDINANMRNLIAELQEGGLSLRASFKEAADTLVSETANTQGTFTSALNDMQMALSSSIEQQTTEHRQNADRVLDGLKGSIEEALTKTKDALEKQIKALDSALEEELVTVMKKMADALAAMTSQFTEDYKDLVNKMNEVINHRS